MGSLNFRGNAGETFVAEFIESRGWKVLKRNYRSRFGEIDIIAAKGETLSFIEVKTRLEGSLYEPKEAVDLRKQRKIILAALQYLEENPVSLEISFDVYEAVCRRCEEFKVKELRIHKNAFCINEENSKGLNF